jgi:hypothetical protein
VCPEIISGSSRPAWKLGAGDSKILYQIKHAELQGKWGYKLHGKAGLASSTQPINFRLTSTNIAMQLD